MRRKVIFIHIPKTAGGTLRYITARQYPAMQTAEVNKQRRLPTISLEELENLSPTQRKKIQLVQGHLPFGAHRFFDEPVGYITLLREPVARILSFYYYVKNIPSHRLGQEIIKHNLSLRDFVLRIPDRNLHNGQTYMLAGKNIAPERALDTAISNLQNHFIAIGLTERFDESILLFKEKLKWTSLFYQKRNSKKQQREPLSEEVIAIIREKNQLDIALYDFGKQIFESQIKSVPHLKRKLFFLKTTNAFYQSLMSFRKIAGKLLDPKN